MANSDATNVCEEFVISGISGQFPNCRNIKEYEEKIYNKECLYDDSEIRWKHVDPAVPRVTGKIPGLAKFDANLFGVHTKLADNMDSQARILLEESFKAIMDAGVNPYSLRGSKIGVFVGACISEAESALYNNLIIPSGFGITGCNKAMFANRISYVLGLIGPSFSCDTACSSSMTAMHLAFSSLEKGEIEGAIVGGSNLCLHPDVTRQFSLLGVLSPTGTCSPFDEAANGYVRSETVGCIFIQKKSVAKRIYASIVQTHVNCDGYKAEGITFPSSVVQERLLKDVYLRNSRVKASDLGYLEAHGTGTVVGDPEECKAIDSAICMQRSEPLYVGSVKGNCGHAESASGICSLVKTIFALQNNVICPNMNFNKLRKGLKAIEEGRLKVVTEPTVLPKPYVGINSFGFGGANAHVVLKQCEKEKVIQSEIAYTWPRLIIWSGRTEEHVANFLSELEQKPLDEEFIGLLHSTQKGGIKNMMYRGYTVLKQNRVNEKPEMLHKSIGHFGGTKRPIVWVFSGMGSQWTGMGKSLMQLPIFKESIERSHNVLKPTGLDLIRIITSDERDMFNNILHSFVGIAAIQIALVDVLWTMGASPDFIIGHSVGELGCAYADKCFTAEQMILAAYYRGKVSVEMEKIKGSMAAVGLGYKDIKPMLPPTIEVACHNNSESCTISGPIDDIAKFVEELKSQNIFAKEVPCSNIAYHSKYIAHFGPQLLKYLKKIIPKPVLRSNKWISTSVPKREWMKDVNKYSSAQYHTNNLLNSVLFEEATAFIPKNAITIEIAPHALLQSILRNAISDGTHIGLTRRNVDDGLLFFLSSIGNIHENGIEVNVDKMYPAISWPVSRSTESLSDKIELDHSHDFYTYHYRDNSDDSGISKIIFNLSGEHQYLKGHEIDGRVLVPATFYLESVWRTFASMKSVKDYQTLAVEFENVKFVRATALSANEKTQLMVFIQNGTGKFEITESMSLVVTGFIRDIIGKTKPSSVNPGTKRDDIVTLEKKDFYKELKLRGYHYNNDFLGIQIARSDGTYSEVEWTNNWVTFMDFMMQTSLIGFDSRNLMLPTRIRQLRIFPQYHQSLYQENHTAQIYYNKLQNKLIAGGIEIVGLHANTVQRRRPAGEPVLEKYEFVPHFPAPILDLGNIARCVVQLFLENQMRSKLQIVELSATDRGAEFLQSLSKAVGDLPLITSTCVICYEKQFDVVDELPGITQVNTVEDMNALVGNIVVIAAADTKNYEATLIENMDSNGFLIIREAKNFKIDEFSTPEDFVLLGVFPSMSDTFLLLQKSKNIATVDDAEVLPISSSDTQFKWIEELQNIIKTHPNVILTSQNEKPNGLLGLVNCLRKEPDTSTVRCVLIDDLRTPQFQKNTPMFAKQLSLGLAINVYRDGKWGTYRHLILPQELPVTPHANHVYGNILRIGDLSTLKWLQGPSSADKLTVKVVYSALNFRDIMVASGRLPVEILGLERVDQNCVFGLEYSGIDMKTGKHIMGMIPKGSVSSHLEGNQMLSWEVPSFWSLKEAATVPVVYLTVYWAFFFTVDIRKGKSILIHAGSGGIGIAAIRVAQAYGLEVYTTVSTNEKKEFLLKTFPKLKEKNIGNSRDTSFEDLIVEQTEGRGVDFVLNSLSEDKLKASVRCLGRGGHFLEIGKFDMVNDNSLELGAFLNELSFHAVLADKIEIAELKTIQALKQFITNDIENGIIKPLPATVFPSDDIIAAFRYLMSGKHIGKVLIQIRKDEKSDVTLPIAVLPQVYFSPELVYIVAGGLGGFGLELIDWMILRGARKVVISSSRGISNTYQKFRISLWQKYGCIIGISTANIGTEQGCLDLLTESQTLGTIGGIFNLAVQLKDSIFENQTATLYEESFAPKAYATKYLDALSRKMCPLLQHFVVFSSVSCGRGNAGQTNYGMANSIMESIIEDRVEHGLPGKAIEWGAVGEVGLVAEMAAGKIDLEIGGTLQQRISSCLEVLDELLSAADPIVSSMVVAEKRIKTAGQSSVQFVMNLLAINDQKSVPANATLAELGMDSLMGVEIKQVLEREHNILLSPADMRSITFPKLIELSENAEKQAPAAKMDVTSSMMDNLKLLMAQVKNQGDFCATDLDIVNDVTDGIPVIIFPGVESTTGEVWHKLGSKINRPTYVLQFLDFADEKNIKTLVDFAYKQIVAILEKCRSKKFNILGFSFGTCVAHFTIARLEEAGYHGQAIFIDGSVVWTESMTSMLKAEFTKEDLELITIALFISTLIPKITVEMIKNDLYDKYLTSERLDYVHNTLKQNNVENINYRMQQIEFGIDKLQIIVDPDTFNNVEIIEAQILLIRPVAPAIPNYDEYYGLTPFTRNEIQVQVLEGNHQTILYNNSLPQIINDFFIN